MSSSAAVTSPTCQIHSTNTFAFIEDRVAIEKSGPWGRKKLEE